MEEGKRVGLHYEGCSGTTFGTDDLAVISLCSPEQVGLVDSDRFPHFNQEACEMHGGKMTGSVVEV